MLNEAVDRVRRREHKELLKQNDQRLTGSRQLWLYNPINLKPVFYSERHSFLERSSPGAAWRAIEVLVSQKCSAISLA
jgi:transposase